MQYGKPIDKPPLFQSARRWLLFIIVASLVFSLLPINSVSILFFVVVFLIEGNFRTKWDIVKKDRLAQAYCLYFLAELISLFTAKDLVDGWKYTESKLTFLAIPVIFSSGRFVTKKLRNDFLLALNISVTAASLYCLGWAVYNYHATGSINSLFYHQLVSPLAHHAVYFAVFAFISFAFLLQEGSCISFLRRNRWLRYTWIIYYVALMILLSSKMVLLVVIIYITYLIAQRYWNSKTRKQDVILAFVLAGTVLCIFTIDTPVKKRFSDVFRGNVSVVEQKKYDQGSYFNGLQFRLLLWRLTYEILNEKHKWLLGVGSPNAQDALREKYRSLNMYAGSAGAEDHGYMDFDTHNQFLQSTLSLGLIGLATVLYIFIMLIARAFKKKSALLTATVFILLCFCFSEAVFEAQYGAVLSTVFPLLLIYAEEDTSPAEGQ